MKGITITKEIQMDFEGRIKELIEIPKFRREIHEWRCEMLCHKNELYFRNNILEDAIIVEKDE